MMEIGRLDANRSPAVAAARPGGSYSYRRLTMSELPALNALYNRCHGTDRPLAEAEWLFRDNPNGEAVIMAAFDDAGTLVGVRPALPWRIVCHGKTRQAYEFADGMVDPQHRNRGIFTRLVKQVAAFAERGDAALFTLPNGNSLPVYRRLPVLSLAGTCETRVKVIAWMRYLAYRLGAGSKLREQTMTTARDVARSGVRLRPVERFDCDLASVRDEWAKRIAVFTRRDNAFLEWRYFGSPLRRYAVAVVESRGQVRGYIVLRIINGVAHVMDIFMALDRRLASLAVGLMIEWAAALGAIAVHLNASRGNFFHDIAADCGFWLRKTSGTLVMDRRSTELLGAAQPGGLDMADLYFVMGDFDFF